MLIINKITVAYVPEEDRLRLAVQSIKGDHLTLWLTARLAVRLVECLIRELEKKVDNQANQNPLQAMNQFNQWQQSASQGSIPVVKEVPSQQEGPTILINAVDVGCRGDGYILTFRWSTEDGVRMVFDSKQIRQWLQIVYGQFKIARWPLTVWPVWFEPSTSFNESPARMLH